jgi:GDPmannose 4,6-dehydratase
MEKRAFITGITGMDGSHLADFLLSKNYKVYGSVKDLSNYKIENISHIKEQITLVQCDITNRKSTLDALSESDPDEVYNLAAQASVGESWKYPETTAHTIGIGCLNILESIRDLKKPIKFFQASSSGMYGKLTTDFADESTYFYPTSPYGVSKLFSHLMTSNYRNSYEMFNCSGILFNHESERRSINFVTKKIINGVAKIKLGLGDKISLGSIDAKRDWGYAPDYVEAMWLMLQQDIPDDYVIATGKVNSIRDFLDISFNECGIQNWDDYVLFEQNFLRPVEDFYLRGNSSKAKEKLNWTPKHDLKDIIKIMLSDEINKLSNNI